MRGTGVTSILALVGAVALAGGWAMQARGAQNVTILNVSYDPTRELYAAINDAFVDSYKAKTGVTATVQQSHGGSSKQARAVIDGLQADVVTLGLGWDVIAIERAGLIKSGWQDKFPDNASPYTSTVAFLVRKGNPKHIKDWSDLLRSDVQVIAPNPKVSGAGRWAFLGLWAQPPAPTHTIFRPPKVLPLRSRPARRPRISPPTRALLPWRRSRNSTNMCRSSIRARAAPR